LGQELGEVSSAGCGLRRSLFLFSISVTVIGSKLSAFEQGSRSRVRMRGVVSEVVFVHSYVVPGLNIYENVTMC